MVEIFGVYAVNEEVHLIEVTIHKKPSEVNVEGFTQETPGVSRDNWQVAYDEYYLNEQGDKVIGDYFEKPINDESPTRLTFFLYFLDLSLPLLTPFGQVDLPTASPMPQRLKDIIEFENAD